MRSNRKTIRYLTKTVTRTPATIKLAPRTLPGVGFSPKKTNAITTASATLSLSMGATRDASPNWRAL